MERDVLPAQFTAGLHGLGLLRSWPYLELDAALAGLSDLEREARDKTLERLDILDTAPGYAAWSSSYDDRMNPLVLAEQPAMSALLEGITNGRALDAACGTGRLTRMLIDHGHEVTGVDPSEAMLERARANVPEATLHAGSLLHLPFPDASFDVVCCGLALTHVLVLQPAIAELARVLRHGGRPLAFRHAPGRRGHGLTRVLSLSRRFPRRGAERIALAQRVPGRICIGWLAGTPLRGAALFSEGPRGFHEQGQDAGARSPARPAVRPRLGVCARHVRARTEHGDAGGARSAHRVAGRPAGNSRRNSGPSWRTGRRGADAATRVFSGARCSIAHCGKSPGFRESRSGKCQSALAGYLSTRNPDRVAATRATFRSHACCGRSTKVPGDGWCCASRISTDGTPRCRGTSTT